MELNLSREDAALLPLFDLSVDHWTMMTKNICVSVLSTSGVSYTSSRHSAAVVPLPDTYWAPGPCQPFKNPRWPTAVILNNVKRDISATV